MINKRDGDRHMPPTKKVLRVALNFWTVYHGRINIFFFVLLNRKSIFTQ